MRKLFVAFLVLTACRDSRRTVVAELERAPGVREGSEVTYLGVEIGKVQAIAFERGRVRLTLAIERPNVPLRTGDRVRVLNTSFFGDNGIDIVPGPGTALLLSGEAVLQPMPPDSLAEARRAVAEAVAAQIGEQVGALFRNHPESAIVSDSALRDTTKGRSSRR